MITLYLTIAAAVFMAIIVIFQRDKISSLSKEVNQFSDSIPILQSRITVISQENTKLNDENLRLTGIDGEQKHHIELMQEKLSELSKDLCEKLENLQNANNLLTTTLRAEEQLREELKVLISDKAIMLENIYELEARLASATRELVEESGKFKDAESIRSSTVAELGALKSSCDKLRNEYINLSVEHKDIRSKYTLIAGDIDGAIAVVRDLSQLKLRIAELEGDKDKLEKEYTLGRERYKNLEEQVSLLEERFDLYSFGVYEPHFSFNSSDAYKEALTKCYEERRALIKSNLAVKSNSTWTINDSKVAGRRMTEHYTKIMLRAFNSECDAGLLKIRWNNVKAIEERIRKSFDAINHLGVIHKINLTYEYLQLRLKEVWLTHEYQEKIHEEREEQRRIRDQIREEERSLKEIDAARQEAEKEETRYTKALAKAREELVHRFGVERDDLQSKIAELEVDLQKAVELKNRAISMAQITKSGYVYIISNIGSFGENIFKIGMTRRLEPTDRVRELGGASVPFSFDIHAMIYSKNAPELENNLHKKFRLNRMNLVNGRKEFFNVSLEEIAACAAELNHDIQVTKLAEARDFRVSSALREKIDGNVPDGKHALENRFPVKLFDELENQNSMDDDDIEEEIS